MVFALDTYNYLCPDAYRFQTEEPEPVLRAETAAVIEPLLAGSRGFLLWDFQLEHILGLYLGDAERCRALRKDFGAKRPTAFIHMERVTVEDGLSLWDFVTARVMLVGTVTPSLEGAATLWRALAG